MVIYLKSFLYLIVFCLITNALHAQTLVVYDSVYVWEYNYMYDDEVELNLNTRVMDVQFENDKIISRTAQTFYDGNWYNSQKYTCQYNQNQSVTSELIQWWLEGEWTNYTKKIREYDAENNQIADIFLEWKDDTWQYNYKFTTEWDQNRKISSVSYLWVVDAWRNSGKDVYAYNTHGDLESSGSFTWNGESWENVHRSFYYYDEQFRVIKRIDQNWYNGVWNNDIQIITNYDSVGEILSIYYYGWSNSEWAIGSRTINEYNLSNQMTSTFQRKQSENWINDRRQGFIKITDYWGLVSLNEWRDEQWCPVMEQSLYINSQTQLYAQVTKRWTEKFDENPGIFKSWDSTYWYANPSVGQAEIVPDQPIIAYPNPSNGLVRVSTDIQSTTIHVYNAAGILIRKLENVAGGFVDIDLVKEPKGVYLIKTNSETHSGSVKVLLE